MSSEFALSYVSTLCHTLCPRTTKVYDHTKNRHLFHTEILELVITDAITNSYTELFKWLFQNDQSLLCPHIKNTYCALAARIGTPGSFEILKYLYFSENNDEIKQVLNNIENTDRISEPVLILEDAIIGGNLDIIQWVFQQSPSGSYEQKSVYGQVAAKTGRIDILKWLKQNNFIFCDDICSYAASAKTNQIEIIEYLRTEGYQWTTRTCTNTARQGRLDVLKWLHESGCPWDEWTCTAAADNGDFEMLKYLCDNGCPLSAPTFAKAAKTGDLEMLKYLYEHQCPFGIYACSNAAQNGHLEILKWLRDHDVSWSSYTISMAVAFGDIEIVKWLLVNKCPWDLNICYNAAGYGHLDILKYLHENGFPWNDNTSLVAAENGHLDILKYLIENGCPWTIIAPVCAVRYGHFDIVQYLYSNIDEYPPDNSLFDTDTVHTDSDVIKIAAVNGYFEIVVWMYKQGYRLPVGFNMDQYAIKFGQTKILKWINKINQKLENS